MGRGGGLVLQVCPALGDDAAEVAVLAGWLRDELLDLDVYDVGLVPGEDVPPGAKGVTGIVGWLSVQLGPEALRTLLAKVADWVTRNDRTVEVSYGGDTLKLSRATRVQQEKIIDDWLARHADSSPA
jgi:hypothetical protein